MSLTAIVGKMLAGYDDVTPQERENIMSLVGQIRDEALEEAAQAAEATHQAQRGRACQVAIEMAATIRALKGQGSE